MRNPEEVVWAWERAWNNADADAIADLFVEDADFVNVVGLWWHDRENIRGAHAFGFEKIFPGSKMSMEEPRVRRIGTGGAVVQSKWHLSGQVSPTGEALGKRSGVFTFVLEERESGWVTVAAHNTDIEPGKQTRANTGDELGSTFYVKRMK